MFKSLLGIGRQWSLEKFAILTFKPRSPVKILRYRTWAIGSLHEIESLFLPFLRTRAFYVFKTPVLMRCVFHAVVQGIFPTSGSLKVNLIVTKCKVLPRHLDSVGFILLL